ncbi:unnamed protein product [Blepharisma stoltei]|uniref:C3H1-type domain-containing protein n=1 Tax=Blepharisma stoltei TaxID=1481888 RepID=A0AAU9JUT9_9CILI|nr:unnamed protein product [Blepharisma stoltei]
MLKDITNLLKPRVKKPIDGTKYKTESCRNWVELGFCHYGDRCNFAHGKRELMDKVPANDKYKSKKCNPFHTKGFCTYGHRCLFLHEIRTLEELPRCYSRFIMLQMSQDQNSKRLPVFKRFVEDEEEMAERIAKDTERYLERIVAGELEIQWNPESNCENDKITKFCY